MLRWEEPLRPEQALEVAAALMVAAGPRKARYTGVIRAVVPPRAVEITSRPGLLAARAASADGWHGFVLVDGEMQAGWLPPADLKPQG
jgi:hypothetical protein